ncbi:hypothetical protein [Coleofasciculus chthonoplastes]|uniref:hypothetical protein n=1 Tax=Coleofasciculus chthonoplastes TaxID=64178 RepID=UPI0032F39E0A
MTGAKIHTGIRMNRAIAQWCKQEEHTSQHKAWRQILSGLLSATVEKLLMTNLNTLEPSASPVTKAMVQNAIEPGKSFD